MVQTALIIILLVVILLFLFTLKVHFLIKDAMSRFEELEVRMLKIENELSSVVERESYLESNLKMALNEISNMRSGGE